MNIKAIVARSCGGPEVLEATTIALRWPRRRDDVLVRLKAAALNPADIYFRQLGPYIASGSPLVLGHDGAGVIESVGAGVRHFAPGDEVCFCNGGIGGEPGTYAEFAVVPAAQLVRKPAGVDFLQAAALPLVAITGQEGLYDRARLRRGERILIHAGAGGTGQLAIQLARLAGATVATTVSNAAKAELVSALGVERIINYREEDFVEAALAWTGGAGLEVALDNVGAETLQRTFRAMAPYGRVVTLMGTPGGDPQTSAYNGNLTIHNVMMLTPMWRGLTGHLRRQAKYVQRAIGWLVEGRLRIRIDRVFSLVEAAAAQRYLESGQAMGKVVLSI